MKLINNYSVSNTNSSARQRAAVRIYHNNIKIAEVFPTSHNPLNYIRTHPKSKYRLDLIEQLKAKKVPIIVINMITY